VWANLSDHDLAFPSALTFSGQFGRA
jgi:hypothetical protein